MSLEKLYIQFAEIDWDIQIEIILIEELFILKLCVMDVVCYRYLGGDINVLFVMIIICVKIVKKELEENIHIHLLNLLALI